MAAACSVVTAWVQTSRVPMAALRLQLSLWQVVTGACLTAISSPNTGSLSLCKVLQTILIINPFFTKQSLKCFLKEA